MKKLFAFIGFAICALAFNVVNAKTIPLPTCDNGQWKMPPLWTLKKGNLQCKSDQDINRSIVQTLFYKIQDAPTPAGYTEAKLFDSQGKKIVLVMGCETYHCGPQGGLWAPTGNSGNMICPAAGSWTAINNCPISHF
jgi:hypothetical protein